MTMSTPTKSCPACSADLSAGTAVPGVCPACGRDLRLEEIVVTLARSPDAKPAQKPPMCLLECAGVSVCAALVLCTVVGPILGAAFEPAFIATLVAVVPSFFVGCVIAGYWKRTRQAQLLYGFLLGAGFAFACLALHFAGFRNF